MAGVLIYTAASDSEGTLGGLCALGEPDKLRRHIRRALEKMSLCASDPLCSEHLVGSGETLHGASCHACSFLPETSCERGNKYLDRSALVADRRANELGLLRVSHMTPQRAIIEAAHELGEQLAQQHGRGGGGCDSDLVPQERCGPKSPSGFPTITTGTWRWSSWIAGATRPPALDARMVAVALQTAALSEQIHR